MRLTILLVVLAGLIGAKGGYELSSYINRPIETAEAVVKQTAEPGRRSWFPPSCPRELTLADGTRWAPPSWSDPACRILLLWSVPR